mgnify:FL=1
MIVKIDSDSTGNYVTHEVPKEVFVAVKRLFYGEVFNRVTEEGKYLVKTHEGQRKSISKYLKIEMP